MTDEQQTDPLSLIYSKLYEVREHFTNRRYSAGAALFDEALRELYEIVHVGDAMAAASASPAVRALIEKARTGNTLTRDEIAAAVADLDSAAQKTVEGWLADLSNVASQTGEPRS